MPLAAIDQVPPTEWNGVVVARANHTQDKESCAEPAATCRYVSRPCDLPYSDRSCCSRYCDDNHEDGQFLHHRVTRFGHAHPHINQRHRKPEGNESFRGDSHTCRILASQSTEQAEYTEQGNAAQNHQHHMHDANLSCLAGENGR